MWFLTRHHRSRSLPITWVLSQTRKALPSLSKSLISFSPFAFLAVLQSSILSIRLQLMSTTKQTSFLGVLPSQPSSEFFLSILFQFYNVTNNKLLLLNLIPFFSNALKSTALPIKTAVWKNLGSKTF